MLTAVAITAVTGHHQFTMAHHALHITVYGYTEPNVRRRRSPGNRQYHQ
ncbi:hypothetical protein N5T16_09465 [Escherichia coli]|nr:hypothetical protein [Escherichia coli]MCW3279133.1 hypothetical protein [Escherichia coli]